MDDIIVLLLTHYNIVILEGTRPYGPELGTTLK